jgi:K+-transporting ATPase ATPase C chain
MSLSRDIRAAIVSVIVFTVVLGLVLPLLTLGIAQVVFPGAANGSKVYVDGRLVGSKLIGQNFGVVQYKNGKVVKDANGNPVTDPDPRYFQSRPSATVPANNAAASTFSNLGPNNVATEQAIATNVQGYLGLNKGPGGRLYDPAVRSAAQVPVDAANSAASGLDPDISVANARIQAYRIAALRGLPLAKVDSLVSTYTTGRSLGFFGEPGVNVLQLNLALNRLTGGH